MNIDQCNPDYVMSADMLRRLTNCRFIIIINKSKHNCVALYVVSKSEACT